VTWSPPTKPDPSIATPTQVVEEAVEYNGAAYRVQPSSRAAYNDSQIPYWAGFTKTTHQYGQDFDANVGLTGIAPPAEGPVGTRQPRSTGSKDDSPQGPVPAHKTNVLSKTTHAETTGEDPAPLFTQSQATGRA
jgi:hypothetical protein